MKHTLDKMFNNDFRLTKYTGIRFILQRLIDLERNDLFFVSPDLGTKASIIQGLMKEYDAQIPRDIFYDLSLLSLDFDENTLLEALGDNEKEINLYHIFAYFAKTSSLPLKIFQRVLKKYSETQSNTLEHFRVNSFLLYYYFTNSSFEMAEKHIKYCLEYLENNGDSCAYDRMVIYNLCARYLERTRDIFAGGAEAYYLEAMRISKELGDEISSVSLMNSLAYFSNNQKNSTKALEYAEFALAASDKLDIDSIRFTTLRNMGIISLTLGDRGRGTGYINSAIDYSYKISNLPSIERIKLLNTLGYTYWIMGRFEESLESHLKALKSLSGLENPSELLDESLKTCDNLSNSFRMLGDLKKSAYFADLAVKFAANLTFKNRANEVHNLCKQYTDAGLIYGLYLNDLETAHKYLKLAKESISEDDHFIKWEKLNILDAFIRARSGDKAEAKNIFERACKNLTSLGNKNTYVQLMLIEFYYFFSYLLDDREKFLQLSLEIAEKNTLGLHRKSFERLLFNEASTRDVPVDLNQYPINLILMISEERRQSLNESKKAKDFELLGEFSKRINSTMSEEDLYSEAQILFNKYFLSKGFICVKHSFNDGFSTLVHLNGDAGFREAELKEAIEDYIEKDELLLSYDTKGYRLYNLENNSKLDYIKSMVMYNVYDEITSCSYFFIIFNDIKCNWSFSEGDAQAGLVLINNLFLKLKHIQYVDSFKSRAITDSLTGLYNSDYMWTTLRKYTLQNSGDLSMIFIDLDKFKQINDRFGHSAGDEALKFFSQLLRVGFNPYNQIIRYGGDEFVLLLPEATTAQAEELVQRLKRLCENNLLDIGSDKVAISFSYGLDSYLGNYRDYNEFFRAVDVLMYLNKRTK